LTEPLYRPAKRRAKLVEDGPEHEPPDVPLTRGNAWILLACMSGSASFGLGVFLVILTAAGAR